MGVQEGMIRCSGCTNSYHIECLAEELGLNRSELERTCHKTDFMCNVDGICLFKRNTTYVKQRMVSSDEETSDLSENENQNLIESKVSENENENEFEIESTVSENENENKFEIELNTESNINSFDNSNVGTFDAMTEQSINSFDFNVMTETESEELLLED